MLACQRGSADYCQLIVLAPTREKECESSSERVDLIKDTIYRHKKRLTTGRRDRQTPGPRTHQG